MDDIIIERVEKVTPELLDAFEVLIPQLTQAPLPNIQELTDLLASPSILIVARVGGKNGSISGMGTLGVFRTPSGLHAHIEDVIVDQKMRARGVGEALVTHLLQLAREMGLKGISLTCNPRRQDANRLYRKMGFKSWDTNVYWFEL
jgi:ribosomal protein S18 acetylase RimI-like enzyme